MSVQQNNVNETDKKQNITQIKIDDDTETIDNIETQINTNDNIETNDDTKTKNDVFNSKWIVYGHDPKNDKWTLDTYDRLIELDNISDFWTLHSCLNSDKLCENMFFVMRDGIPPQWEHEKNIEGGYYSFKILKCQLKAFWEDILIQLLGETILSPELRKNNWMKINGISTSPKKNFCIIKLWMADKTIQSGEQIQLFFSNDYKGNLLFKPYNPK